METLREDFICEKALAYLWNRHYRRSGYYNFEEYTKDNKRADGFLAFPHKRGKAYLVSLEAKSRNTINNLVLHDDHDKILEISRWTVGLILFIIGIFAYREGVRQNLEPLWISSLVALAIFGIVLFFRFFKRLSLSILKSVPALQQLRQYPANESWLAIGNDSIVKRKVKQDLKRQCKKAGIGLLEVFPNGTVRRIFHPRPKGSKDYLNNYLEESSIRQEIGTISTFKATPAQISQTYRMYGNGFSFLIIFLLASYLFRPDSNGRFYQNTLRSDVDVENFGKLNVRCDDVNLFSEKFIILDAVFEDKISAEKRVAQLFSFGFTDAHYMHLSCVETEFPGSGYCVMPFLPEREITVAESQRKYFFKILDDVNVDTGYGRIVEIWPLK